jgi:hypothetical protein
MGPLVPVAWERTLGETLPVSGGRQRRAGFCALGKDAGEQKRRRSWAEAPGAVVHRANRWIDRDGSSTGAMGELRRETPQKKGVTDREMCSGSSQEA